MTQASQLDSATASVRIPMNAHLRMIRALHANDACDWVKCQICGQGAAAPRSSCKVPSVVEHLGGIPDPGLHIVSRHILPVLGVGQSQQQFVANLRMQNASLSGGRWISSCL